jgi:Ulp1 family protease
MRLLNSFFATTYLQKDEKMIQRFLKKKSIEPQHSLIMPINYGNHWFFATLNP